MPSLASMIGAGLMVAASGADLDITGGKAILGYVQLGVRLCKSNTTLNDMLGTPSDHLGFASDSLEECARQCDCAQGCQSFNWDLPETYDGKASFVLDKKAANIGIQGRSVLQTSDCEGGNQVDKTPTDNPIYEKDTSEVAGVYDAVGCLLASAGATNGMKELGGGGALPSVCLPTQDNKVSDLADLEPDGATSTYHLSTCSS
ncbi:unnamed protein product [Polarella glacialis]|uniref:Subtilisin n=1 Tax=Polarella glacialis TaxID=89957 RepID=A0A813FBI9_POLGL|nr:unnamed protein product [Polarella glacialis]CAE8608805.1 unnamed protein product [Polarella glacialis]